MNPFFSRNTHAKTVTHGAATFDLPVNYYRDDLSLLFYTANFEAVSALMPSRQMHPVRLPGGRTLVGFSAFNYIETTIGPYGERKKHIPEAQLPALRAVRNQYMMYIGIAMVLGALATGCVLLAFSLTSGLERAEGG